MAERKTWRQLRAERSSSPEYRASYDQTKQAYEIGKRVRELRIAAGLSQTDLAERMNSTQSVIARLELGGAEPRFETLGKVAAALDLELVVDLRPHQAGHSTPQRPAGTASTG